MNLGIMNRCIQCDTPYNLEDLYCRQCGHILLHRLNDLDATRKINGVQHTAVNLDWGTAYFHHRARLFLEIAATGAVLPVPPSGPSVIIGRRSDHTMVDVDLTPFDAPELGISRNHVRVDRMRDVLHITDLHSANGTYLNWEWLVPDISYTLRNRAVLQLGQMVFNVRFG